MTDDAIMEPDSKEQRLPQWVQQRLNDLRSRVRFVRDQRDDARQALGAINGDLHETNTLATVTDYGQTVPLPNDSTVAFRAGGVYFDVQVDGDILRIQADAPMEIVLANSSRDVTLRGIPKLRA